MLSLLHEFGHALDNHYKWVVDNLASDYLPRDWLEVASSGFKCDDFPCVQHPSWLEGYDATELFADLFLNWVLDLRPEYPQNGFNYTDTSGMGMAWSTWMDSSNPYYTGVGMPYFLIYGMGIQVIPYHVY